MTWTRSGEVPSRVATIFCSPCGYCVADHTVTLPSERTSATAQLGPIMPWFSYGVWYVAVSVCAADASADGTSPRVSCTESFDGSARSAVWMSVLGGSLLQLDHVTWRACAPLIASHSFSPTTATRLPTVIALTPDMAGTKLPTETSVEPMALGWMTRAWSMLGTRTSC